MLKTLQKFGKWKTLECDSSEGTNFDINTAISTIQKKIMLFSDSQNWYLRQLFLQSCIKIAKFQILPSDTVNECMIPKYLDMCINDPVPNNRMVGGLGLSSLCNHG